jgi:hypothetical protein
MLSIGGAALIRALSSFTYKLIAGEWTGAEGEYNQLYEYKILGRSCSTSRSKCAIMQTVVNMSSCNCSNYFHQNLHIVHE